MPNIVVSPTGFVYGFGALKDNKLKSSESIGGLNTANWHIKFILLSHLCQNEGQGQDFAPWEPYISLSWQSQLCIISSQRMLKALTEPWKEMIYRHPHCSAQSPLGGPASVMYVNEVGVMMLASRSRSLGCSLEMYFSCCGDL